MCDFEEGTPGWIQEAIRHPSFLRRIIGIPKSKRISISTLKRIAAGCGVSAKRAQLALNLRKVGRS